MSSMPPTDDELTSLLTNVLTETPTATRPPSVVEKIMSGRNIALLPRSQQEGVVSSVDNSYTARVNRLTFVEPTNPREGVNVNVTGTFPQRRVDSLYIDVAGDSGMESSEGMPMLSARSTGNSTIESVLDVTPVLYEIFKFPMNVEGVQEMCNQRQSGGITACIRTNCKLNHRGPRIDFLTGSIVVARSRSSVFINPVTHHTNISAGLFANWQNNPRVLEEWNDLFRMVNIQTPSQVFTLDVLADHTNFDSRARNRKPVTPHEKNGNPEEQKSGETKSNVFTDLVKEEIRVLLDRFVAQALLDAGADMDVTTSPKPILKTGEWSYDEAFKRLEVNSDINRVVVSKISHKLDEMADGLNDELEVLFNRIQRTECALGPKVVPENPNFDSPTVWGGIATLAAGIDELQSELIALKAGYVQSVVAMEGRLEKNMEDQMREVIDSATMVICEQNQSLEESVAENTRLAASSSQSILMLARGAAKLKDEMADLRSAMILLSSSNMGGATATTEDSTVNTDISSIKLMIKTMGHRIDLVVEGRETKAVKFFGSVFRGNTEAETWVLENLDNDSFGLIVDAHLVLEHAFHQAFSDDGALKELNGLYKIKIDNITQGLALSSFDHPMPKFFSVPTNAVNKKPKIKKPDASHFDNIDNYEDWDLPIMGFRAKLKDQLEEFESTHLRMINEVLSPEDPAYRVATMSVQSSVSWVQSFIAYLDETYTDTSRLSSFTSARAWQLVTQIGRRILTDVAAPRNGVKKLFRVGDNMKISQTMFWPMVQSHELMARYKKANFKDDPSVSNEFMKFMATNSGSTDGLSGVHAKMLKLEAELKESLTKAKGANTSATASANKADDNKRLLTSLIQRVTILEKQAK